MSSHQVMAAPHGGPLAGAAPVVLCGVEPTTTTPMKIRVVPSHLCGLTSSCRKNLPNSAANTYPMAVSGSTNLQVRGAQHGHAH